MDQSRTTHLNNLEILLEHLDSLPGEIAALREQLAPPKYRAAVQRILTSLDSQVARLKARGLDVEGLEANLTTIRTEQE